ncbi:ATP-binding protein [Sinorhizobium meliloti]|uniref:ATP-binding protein n=1 Tax=Rhizobium meliloti TaxID=382 RepID=UPI000FD26FFD|nr:ATP-binding protein [Sinorhizobium meliloti]RVM09363.1 ATP-binding protein [Sinorhizobium meliloti]RVM50001.1 ATP-binding protein [Sinorhizobium meliloti]RVM66784.1 ATP-binding protein [Sinorhizobium meliloti]RVM72985.1 ATP-binding protein [Sinorhizobium meliloti]RVM87621.1 ATP-binding protein [Sinorhizobium meliloti]
MTDSEFNLEPSPRVLPMLGEINLDQWRCIAELVDNSVDGFLKQSREDSPVPNARVDVILPASDKEGATVRIQDNGSGMSVEVLEQAVRAGWSGNNPIDSLGLFGMGFNIATARLGSVTEVWTTRKGELEWHGLMIDFDELRRQRHFRTPKLTRPKADPEQHGTEVTIKKLKPEQRKWLAKTANQTTLRKRLAQAYSAMLRPNGVPINFELYINNKRLEARRHCVWNEDRVVPGVGGASTNAVIPINHALPGRFYCTNCLTWVPEASESEPCPLCAAEGSVVKRQRRIKGWLGIQRYLDQSEYGIDFIRNGRKIEISNKDLFSWNDGEESEEREYPIDDPRNRGRIVGEIHIDHCRVSYAKDRFDRADPTWNEMVQLLRGEGPLRPEKAKDLGFPPNESPLFALFRAFRRTSPHSKTAGAYARILIVKDNNLAMEMASYFHDGHPEYQDDTKWWELVESADRELLYGQPGQPGQPGGQPAPPAGGDGGLPPGLVDNPPPAGQPPTPTPPATALPQRRDAPNLTRKYHHQPSGLVWNVVAFEVAANDPELPSGVPWTIVLGDIPTKTYHYLYNPLHPVFQSITMTPRDGVLTHLAYMTADQTRSSRHTPDIALILSEFRSAYSDENALDFKALPADAAAILVDVARALVNACPQEERPSLFNDLSVQEQTMVMRALAGKKIKPSEATIDGSFLQSAPADIIKTLVIRRPELCFDGKIWDEPYTDLDYGDAEITEDARRNVLSKYVSLVSDAIWLSKQDLSDLGSASKDEIIRAVMSLQLLRPDVEPSQ